jgi:hypothetical protein
MAAQAATQASFNSAKPVKQGAMRRVFMVTIFTKWQACLGGRLRGHDEKIKVGPFARRY